MSALRLPYAAGLLLCSVAWADADSGSAPASFAGSNVILVSIDTLRADRLGAYGYERPTSPWLDELAERGVRFELAVAE